MSTHPNNNSFGSFIGKIFFVIIAILVLSRIFSANNTSVQKSVQPTTHSVQNPIEQMLRAPANVAPRDGIAVAVLMDTSGSMADNARDPSGKMVPKIEIARRSTINLLEQIDRFAQLHKDRTLLIGVYEFSARQSQQQCRVIVPLGALNLGTSKALVETMNPGGGTPIGDAIITAKRDLDKTGLSHRHILVVTDGENNQGYSPGDVADVISRQPVQSRASLYFVAFDVAAEKFKAVRDAGGLVLPATDERELQQTLDYVLTGKILVEQPEIPK